MFHARAHNKSMERTHYVGGSWTVVGCLSVFGVLKRSRLSSVRRSHHCSGEFWGISD